MELKKPKDFLKGAINSSCKVTFVFLILLNFNVNAEVDNTNCLEDYVENSETELSSTIVDKLLLELILEGSCNFEIANKLKTHPLLIPQLSKIKEGIVEIVIQMQKAGEIDLVEKLANYVLETKNIDDIGHTLYTFSNEISEPLFNKMLLLYLNSTPTYCDVVLSNLKQSNKAQVLDEILKSREAQNLPICGSIDYEPINL
ncbi:MAG: hypothetical protein R3E90_07875 [Marinicella sp.]